MSNALNEPRQAIPKSQEEQLVDAKGLLSMLWDESSRPSLRWLREQQSRRTIPFIKIGARVWFQPSVVIVSLRDNWGVKRRACGN
jgi:hypothetical protein